MRQARTFLKWVVFEAVAVIICGLVLLNLGCAMFNPGGQVRQAIGQRFETVYSADEFRNTGEGGQEVEITLAEGLVVMKDGENGPVLDLERSALTAYFHMKPSGQAAVSASAIFAEMGARQIESMERTLQNVLAVLAPLLRPPPAPKPEVEP